VSFTVPTSSPAGPMLCEATHILFGAMHPAVK
jgi:hypothetical protein